MAPRRLTVSIALLVPVLVIASCSDASSPGSANAETDASSGDSAPAPSTNDGATALDGSSDSLSAAETTGADAPSSVDGAVPDAGPPCTDLVDLSSGVVPVKQTGSAPIPSGGSFAAGTYVLTKVEYWGGTLSGTWTGTYRFSASGYEYANGSYREQGEVIFSSSNDDQWTQRVDCPAQSNPWLFYFFSASGDEIVLHNEAPDGPRLRTFTRVMNDAGGGG